MSLRLFGSIWLCLIALGCDSGGLVIVADAGGDLPNPRPDSATDDTGALGADANEASTADVPAMDDASLDAFDGAGSDASDAGTAEAAMLDTRFADADDGATAVDAAVLDALGGDGTAADDADDASSSFDTPTFDSALDAATFDSALDSEADADGGAPIDAPATPDAEMDSTVDVAADVGIEASPPDAGRLADSVTKITTSAPLFATPFIGSGDCGEFAVGHVPDGIGGLTSDERVGTVVVDPDGATLWVMYLCKWTDSGWSAGLLRWQPPNAATAIRIDGDPATAGVQPVLSVFDNAPDSTAVGSLQVPGLWIAPDGSVVGTIRRAGPPLYQWGLIRLRTSSIAMIDESALEPMTLGDFVGPGSGWATTIADRWEHVFHGDRFYSYVMALAPDPGDGGTPAPTADGLPNLVIGVVEQNADMTTRTWDPSPLVEGWADPMITESGGVFHMVARRLETNSYYYIRGSDPRTFAFNEAQPLDLHTHVGPIGTWDSTRFSGHAASGDPKVLGARVLGGVMYVHYLAGVPRGSGATFRGTRGGIGVLAFPVP